MVSCLLLGFIKLWAFSPALWIFLGSHILRQPAFMHVLAATLLLTRRSARLETSTHHVENDQSWLTSQISSCVSRSQIMSNSFIQKVAYKAHFCNWSIAFLWNKNETWDIPIHFGDLGCCQLPTKRTRYRSLKLPRPVFIGGGRGEGLPDFAVT